MALAGGGGGVGIAPRGAGQYYSAFIFRRPQLARRGSARALSQFKTFINVSPSSLDQLVDIHFKDAHWRCRHLLRASREVKRDHTEHQARRENMQAHAGARRATELQLENIRNAKWVHTCIEL